jgi:thioesterase domain-containing protein
VDGIGLHDDFSELGGDSLQAIELAGEVERQFGVRLPASVVAEAPCIAEMARHLGWPAIGHATLVPLSAGGTARPFFCVHDGTGDVIAYRELARLLGPEQPVIGLRARGLDGREVPSARVETMAARYIVEMRTVQGAGPYFLGGNCFGGVIAFEMARQLRFAGEAVGLLVLMDTGYPTGRLWSKVARHRRRLTRRSWTQKVSYLGALLGRIGARLAADLRSALPWGRGGGRAAVTPEEQVMAANFQAEWGYRPGPCDVATVLIHAGPPHNQLGWRRVLGGNMRVVELPDDHADNHLVEPPNVTKLAAVVRECLRDAGAG